MQRVVSIQLNGNTYQLEEAGYNSLFAYLDARETQLQDDPERAQKMADLEREVAEKIQACLTPTKTIVTSAEIERVIGEFGPIPDVGPEQTSSQQASSPAGSTSNVSGGRSPSSHRRLYQIRDGAMISGVCVGLSEYMHIDVTLLRIMFVIFALVSAGWGILAYGALMILLPSVATRADAASGTAVGSHHWPWDNGWPWDRHGWPWDRYGWPWDRPTASQQAARDKDFGAYRATAAPAPSTTPPTPSSSTPPPTPDDPRQAWRQQRQEWREQRREWREQRRAARMEYHPWPIWGTMSMVIFLMFGFFWLSFWTRGHFFFGWPFFWGFPHWIGIIFFFMLLRLVFMPFRSWRYGYGYGPYGPYPHPAHAWISMWNGLAWFLIVIFGFWLAYHYIPEVHDMIREFQTSMNDGFHV
jgi:phage shock protein PspC (stress-responsive transcriptional regulator)